MNTARDNMVRLSGLSDVPGGFAKVGPTPLGGVVFILD